MSMSLEDFLHQTQADVAAEVATRLQAAETPYPHPELVFTEVVMAHMSDVGMTFETNICHYAAKVGNAAVKLSGYAVSEEGDQLDLFVSLYEGATEVTPVADGETKAAADQCLRFLARCAEGKMAMDPSHEAYELAQTIHGCYPDLEQIRIYVLTDRLAKSKNFKPREVAGKTVKLEVMDIERLHRHWSEGKPRDELIVDFQEVCGSALPCVYVPADGGGYDYALTAIPGSALRLIYEKFGARLLEANVRSFLSATGKVNRGIRDTLRDTPERFMAYNNGVVLVADEARLGQSADGGTGLLWLKGMQIVNGGQTTASIYFTKKRSPEIDLTRVRVPAKIIVLRSHDPEAEEALILDISRYANSQNAVKVSDLSANKPFHIEFEKLAISTYRPDGVGRWFYERAAGSYNVMLAREGTTPARLAKLKEAIPPARKFNKTDLAKFINIWGGRPDLVSLGSQKNFERFMAELNDGAIPMPDVTAYKRIIAQAILFKATQRQVRTAGFQAYQANIATYTLALVADRLGPRLSLDAVWQRQGLSPALEAQIRTWASEVNDVLRRTAGERMISEWAKKPECWAAVRQAGYSQAAATIPELS